MEVEWIILADSAEVVNNKAYILGGGWETLTPQEGLPFAHRFALVFAFSVPWSETNRRHNIEFGIDDPEGNTLLDGGLEMEVGRPPGLVQGQDQRAMLSVNLDMSFETAGTHSIAVRVEGQERKRLEFNVLPGAGLVLNTLQ